MIIPFFNKLIQKHKQRESDLAAIGALMAFYNHKQIRLDLFCGKYTMADEIERGPVEEEMGRRLIEFVEFNYPVRMRIGRNDGIYDLIFLFYVDKTKARCRTTHIITYLGAQLIIFFIKLLPNPK